MKKRIISSSLALSALLLLSGCLVIGNRGQTAGGGGTTGQQLIDLKTAQANGAISEAEYQTLKAKVIGNK
jgi:hypothetical protein